LAASAQGVAIGNTYDRIAAAYLSKYWLEVGFSYVGDSAWTLATTKTNNFTNPVVLAGLPQVGGTSHTEGFPSTMRIKRISTVAGRTSFYLKWYQANDSYCLTTWYTPVHHDPIQVGWIVVEQGAYVLDGHNYIITKANVTRSVSQFTAQTDFVAINFPLGCGGVSTRCSFPSGVALANLGFMSSLQDLVYDKFLMVRGQSINRNLVRVQIWCHDTNVSSYYIMTTPTSAGLMAFESGYNTSCVEGISFETARDDNVTSRILYHKLINKYDFAPGVFGMLISTNSLVDSTGLRVPAGSVTTTQYGVITQEDTCLDEQQIHTTPESTGTFVAGDSTSAKATLTCFIKYTSSNQPTPIPTSKPSPSPTVLPTSAPSKTPTVKPTASPTTVPTHTPTASPTAIPTTTPSSAPSVKPTASPTSTPTLKPTEAPTGTCSGNTFTVTMTQSA